MNSSRPYLVRALDEWIVDNDCTRHLLVSAEYPGVQVPPGFASDGQIVLNGKPVPQEVEPPVQLPADPKLSCSDREPAYHCYADFMQYRTRLPSGREVFELPTLRETMPNGATYLTIDYTEQRLDNYGPYTVPADSVFVMGDNRDESADSRAEVIESGLGGAVPLANIGGRAEFITFSLDGSTTWNPASWFSSLRGDRAWTTLRPPLAEGAAAK